MVYLYTFIWFFIPGLKPDIICLENACGVMGNSYVIKELTKFGLKYNKVCLENCIRAEGSYMIKEVFGNIDENSFVKNNVVAVVEVKHEDKKIEAETKNEEKKEVINDEEDDMQIVDVKQKRMFENKEEKIVLNSKGKNLLGVSHNDLIFSDLRRLLLAYIYENDLFEKKCVRINTGLSKVLGLDRNDYFRFNDLGAAISHMVK